MTRTRAAIAGLLLALPLSAVAGPKGHLFIVGGGDWPDGMMSRFVDLAARFGTGRIIILPMASSVPEESAAEETDEFRKLGAKDVATRILTREQALRPESAALLDGAGGVFFSGGDQSRLTAVLLDTPVHKKLLELYEQGAVIGGTSAGAAVMSEVMITGDEVRKPEAGREFETLQAANVVTTRGFGFIREAVIDQHFVTRKRHNRLISLLAEHPDLLGVAIDESTAVLVRPDGTFEVIGAKQVVVYDPAGAKFRVLPNTNIAFAGLVMHALVNGDTFDLKTRKTGDAVK
jgi:cyanophycinase